jgi:(1->4)-alpha-D-glucan 1-alpha-D-glucosylmutase
VRARINVLSEIPDLWEANLKKWSRMNRKKKKMIRGVAIPDKNDEYFLYQTLIGAFPFNEEEYDSFRVRLKEYIIKAVREAKVYTAWLKPDSDYEDNYLSFIDRILEPSDKNQFWGEFLQFQKMISFYGIFNSLSQTLLKIASPGFPDFYQGSEFWDLNLVDPDNRRPVDFSLRAWLFREMKSRETKKRSKLIRELFSTRQDGRIKLFLIYKALAARQKQKNLFEKGNYSPVKITGEHKESIIAFAWELKPLWAVIIAPRFLTGFISEDQEPIGVEVWGDTKIVMPGDNPSVWTEEITNTEIKSVQPLFIGNILKSFPCAIMIKKADKN